MQSPFLCVRLEYDFSEEVFTNFVLRVIPKFCPELCQSTTSYLPLRMGANESVRISHIFDFEYLKLLRAAMPGNANNGLLILVEYHFKCVKKCNSLYRVHGVK